MLRRLALTITVFSSLLLLSQPALAQTTGDVRGLVLDPDAQPLPGVTVTLASDAIMGGTRTTVTGPNGTYRFFGLPPGDYDVTAALQGFQTLTTENVRVRINAVATVNFALQIAALEESISVTGESPLVDVASSSVGTSYDAEFIEDLPTARNFWDLMQVAPGMASAFESSTRISAFGSANQSNAWLIDGLDATSPDGGTPWWWLNPDSIEEIQVLGIGAPAEFGNMMGAAFNVVTKSGSNSFHGGGNYFWQSDALTGENVFLEGEAFPTYRRELFRSGTAQLGGPIARDRVWFFGAYEHWRDGDTQPLSNPAEVTVDRSDRLDLKITTRIGDNHFLDGKIHQEYWEFPGSPSQFRTPDATGAEGGTNPAWGANWRSILNDDTYFEINYAGWWGDDEWMSITGSQEPNFTDWSPPDGGPPISSQGVIWPWTYVLWREQLNGDVTHYAEDFLKGDQEFKFGVQFSLASAETDVAPGPTGTYYYRYEYYPGYPYYYRAEARAYTYGSKGHSIGLFVDDSWNVTDRLSLNLGLRYDRNVANIPEYDLLDNNWEPTGETLPGVDPAILWNKVSPRLGFAFVPTDDFATVIRGSFGVYYDANVMGNWNYPPPDSPTITYSWSSSLDGPWTPFATWSAQGVERNTDLKPPRTLQYAVGFERQLADVYSVGLEYVYKSTRDLIGWHIGDDGVFEPFLFTDPFTGTQYTLLNQIVQPTLTKGNSPGFTVNADLDSFWQSYHGVFLTFNKRFSSGWSLRSSYTWSRSRGVLPTPLSQTSQGSTLFGSSQGSDPNHYLNAAQLLQADRPHMLRVQGNFDLPWGMDLTTMINLQSGRPYGRQARARLNQGNTTVIMEPASNDRRLPAYKGVDIGIGKRVPIQGATLKLDAQVFNLLNQDTHQWFRTLVLAPGDELVPGGWVLPRRVMLRGGFEF